jgi:hypothetical protein
MDNAFHQFSIKWLSDDATQTPTLNWKDSSIKVCIGKIGYRYVNYISLVEIGPIETVSGYVEQQVPITVYFWTSPVTYYKMNNTEDSICCN